MERQWISLNEFMRRNHLGYEMAIRLINSGKVEYQKSESGQYKIKVSRNDQIDELTEKLIRENEELRTRLKAIKSLVRVERK